MSRFNLMSYIPFNEEVKAVLGGGLPQVVLTDKGFHFCGRHQYSKHSITEVNKTDFLPIKDYKGLQMIHKRSPLLGTLLLFIVVTVILYLVMYTKYESFEGYDYIIKTVLAITLILSAIFYTFSKVSYIEFDFTAEKIYVCSRSFKETDIAKFLGDIEIELRIKESTS